MKPIKLSAIAAVALITASVMLPASGAAKGAKPMPLTPGWTNDFKAARQQAAEEDKALLIEFTGSDWCGPCILLKKSILSKEAFIDAAKPHFVLVQLDLPRDKSMLSPETVEQNRMLVKRYQVRSYPTLILADSDGRPFSYLGFFRGAPEEFAEQAKQRLSILADRDKALKQAANLSGPAKAEAVSEALKAMKLKKHHIETFYADVAGPNPNSN